MKARDAAFLFLGALSLLGFQLLQRLHGKVVEHVGDAVAAHFDAIEADQPAEAPLPIPDGERSPSADVAVPIPVEEPSPTVQVPLPKDRPVPPDAVHLVVDEEA